MPLIAIWGNRHRRCRKVHPWSHLHSRPKPCSPPSSSSNIISRFQQFKRVYRKLARSRDYRRIPICTRGSRAVTSYESLLRQISQLSLLRQDPPPLDSLPAVKVTTMTKHSHYNSKQTILFMKVMSPLPAILATEFSAVRERCQPWLKVIKSQPL